MLALCVPSSSCVGIRRWVGCASENRREGTKAHSVLLRHEISWKVWYLQRQKDYPPSLRGNWGTTRQHSQNKQKQPLYKTALLRFECLGPDWRPRFRKKMGGGRTKSAMKRGNRRYILEKVANSENSRSRRGSKEDKWRNRPNVVWPQKWLHGSGRRRTLEWKRYPVLYCFLCLLRFWPRWYLSPMDLNVFL